MKRPVDSGFGEFLEIEVQCDIQDSGTVKRITQGFQIAWLSEGRIRYREDITDGLENAPRELIRLLPYRKASGTVRKKY